MNVHAYKLWHTDQESRFKVNLSYVLQGKFKGILGYMGPCLINKSIKQNPNNIE